jgi:zinc transporter ZupT
LQGYYALADMTQMLPTVLAIASASLLYVAVADLIPSLHRRPEPVETAKQMLAIGLGLAIIAGVHSAAAALSGWRLSRYHGGAIPVQSERN